MVQVEGQRVHFAALWSKKENAIPLLLLHGCELPSTARSALSCIDIHHHQGPGSFLEFLPILSLLKDKYTPETLPYNVIVPSLPGFGFSARPPVDKEFGTRDIARVFDGLMQGLGFDAYAVQGGDLGSKISRVLGAEFASCKGEPRGVFSAVFTRS